MPSPALVELTSDELAILAGSAAPVTFRPTPVMC
jgi:hypothetical protein